MRAIKTSEDEKLVRIFEATYIKPNGTFGRYWTLEYTKEFIRIPYEELWPNFFILAVAYLNACYRLPEVEN